MKSRASIFATSAVTFCAVLLLSSFLAPPLFAQASIQGQWQTLGTQMPINPVHVALMHNGKVLVVSGSGNLPSDTNYMAAVFDPTTGTVTTQAVGWDMFCNGMIVLPDGRPFVMGGTLQYDPFYGEVRTSAYDPATGSFVDLEPMAHGRWYPTATTLSDGSVLIFSGLLETGATNPAVEIYKLGSGWSQQYVASWTPPLYPRMHLLPNGNVFYSGATTSSAIFNTSTHTWTTGVANTNYSGTRTYGTSVLFPLTPANGYKPKVIIMGGGSPSTATTEIIDLSVGSPKWVNGPPMSQPRIEMNATILPNGKFLVTGGSLNDEDGNTASLNADLYDPNANSFSSGGANAFPRLYHSNSILLPDATVLLLGSNPARGTYEPHMEIYSPPYLFNSGGGLATRPTISGVTPGVIGYGNAFQVQTPDAASISSAVLIRAGAVTHAFDMDQRLVGLSFTAGSGVLNVTGPPNGNIAPPGYYLLFLLNSSGVPSVAKFVQVSATPTDQPPTGSIVTPATDKTIAAGGAVAFSGSGSDPDGTISGYKWVFPGGNPSSSSLANPGNVIFSATGTYVASLTVTDNAGLTDPSPKTRTINVGASSSNIRMVQLNYATPQASISPVTLPFTAAQATGDLNVVVVGWNDTTSSVSSVTDTAGNNYVLAAGPTAVSGTLSQSIYFARNIAAAAAGTNTVTVKFNTPAAYPDVRILEYAGLDINSPLDVSAAASGTSATASSGSATTTYANDLLVAADTIFTNTPGPGTGYTARVITVPDSDLVEDATVSSTGSYSATAPLSPAAAWVMQMVAFKAAGASPPDTTPPTAPSNLTAAGISSTQINLSWNASTDNVGVTGYLIERCLGSSCSNFAQVATVASGTTYSDTGLTVLTVYSYRVRATDAAGNLSGYSGTATASTPDTTPPSTPSGLGATATSTSQINLSWTASTDNVGVTAYLIERCQGAACASFAQIASIGPGTTYSDTGLTASTSYSYRVRATDAANNLSAYSNTASATTQSVPDTQPPTAPTSLAANPISSVQINLTWTTSTDNVGVTGYKVERCQGAGCTSFAQIAAPAGTTYSDTGLLANTTYLYRVRATDAAGNLSGYSNTASATTLTGPPPGIKFVQVNYATPQSTLTTVAVTYTATQGAGDLNVVIVGWNDTTSSVASVKDSSGNTYALAAGPTAVSGFLSQSIYYLKNIAGAAAGGNTVTVTFNKAAAFPDIRILEYSGIDTTSPLDVTASGSGNSNAAATSSATTTNANDLIIGADMIYTFTSGPGSGFTSRTITSPDGDIAEDKIVTVTGSYSASAPLNDYGPWVMQMVAFKAHP
jgi:chitodextrinase